jgi:hypothetical protein
MASAALFPQDLRFKHVAQAALSDCVLRCKAVQSHSLIIVLRNAPSLVVTHSNHKQLTGWHAVAAR